MEINLVRRLKNAAKSRFTRDSSTSDLPELDKLLDHHFARYSQVDHVNRVGLTVALRQMRNEPALILETGSSAWGTDSSKLFDSYVHKFGGYFHTVDIRPEAASELSKRIGKNSFTHVGDSVEFLQSFELPAEFDRVSLVYLDSWDLDLQEPAPAMKHGLDEFFALQSLLGPGSLVVVDDTPIDPTLLGTQGVEYWHRNGVIPGKGARILSSPIIKYFETLYHHYNLVLRRK